MRRVGRGAAALLVAAGLGAAALPAPAGATPPPPVPATAVAAGRDTLDWSGCGDGFECSTLRVPRGDPGGATIDLAVIRLPARDPARRIGSLVFNPGGPGASGVEFLRSAASIFGPVLRDRFDLVSFDPRGTGASAPIDCTADLSAYYRLDFSPDDDQERAELVAGVQRLVDACVARHGDLLPYVSTSATVDDLERLRLALGDERLTYVGYSYGTYLGAKYADRYPNRVRALVLDGAVDPALDAEAGQVEQAQGFERSLDRFLAWCDHSSRCAFGSGGGAAGRYDRLTTRIDARPVAVGTTSRRLDQTEFELGVAEALYLGRAGWPGLAGALEQARRGDGAAMASLADDYTGRDASGHYGAIEAAFLAIGCADGPPLGGLAGLRAIEDHAVRVAPRLGAAIVNNSLACALWPVTPPPAAPVRAAGAPPILVIGTDGDPATPRAWAAALARELESGVLLRARGEQHTAFASGNVCVDRIVERYLVTLTPPTSGRRC